MEDSYIKSQEYLASLLESLEHTLQDIEEWSVNNGDVGLDKIKELQKHSLQLKLQSVEVEEYLANGGEAELLK